MTNKISVIYKAARNDNDFLAEIYEADKDTKPSIFASEVEKHLFAMCYYGWLVGKYGNKWESELTQKIEQK